MTVKVVPGFYGKISIYRQNGEKIFTKEMDSEEEINIFKKGYMSSPQGYSLWRATLFPIRPNKHFISDLLFPLYSNAVKSQNAFFRVIENIVSLLVDLVFLPVRVLCLPIRLYQISELNTQKFKSDYTRETEFPILKLVRDYNVKKDKGLKVKIKWKKTVITPNNEKYETAETTNYKYKLWIPLKRIPGNCRIEKESARIFHETLRGGEPI